MTKTPSSSAIAALTMTAWRIRTERTRQMMEHGGMPTGAEVIVSGLVDAGVEVVFGLPGVHNLALWEALRGSPIRLVGVRHEQAAVYAADGYARRPAGSAWP